MKQRVAVVATILGMLSIFGAPAAQASCTEVVEGRCLENDVCAVVLGLKPTSGWNCIE